MKYATLEEWKTAAEDGGCTVKQLQGYEQYEALKDDLVVGRFSGEGDLTLPDSVDQPGIEP